MTTVSKDVKYWLTWPDYVRAVPIPLDLFKEFEEGGSLRLQSKLAKEIMILAIESHAGKFDYGIPRIVVPQLLTLRSPFRIAAHKRIPRIKPVIPHLS